MPADGFEYTVFIEERCDELSRGACAHLETDDIEEAHREVHAARWAYPLGAAWVENSAGEVIPTEPPSLNTQTAG